jgi:cystinosin
MADDQAFLNGLSHALGVVYVLLWGSSFYPQIYENYKRKSVEGVSVTYYAYNILGHVCYTIYTLAYYLTQRKYDLALSVDISDVVFGAHSIVCVIVTLWQLWYYDAAKDETGGVKKPPRVHGCHKIALALMCVVIAVVLALAVTDEVQWIDTTGKQYAFSFIDVLGYVKMVVTVLKYSPQVYMNYARQSTEGFSIGMVLLDIGGGSLALVQQGVDGIREDTWSAFTTNVPKLCLSVLTIIYDGIILFQHYALYRKNNGKHSGAEKLARGSLNGGDEEEPFMTGVDRHSSSKSLVYVSGEYARIIEPQEIDDMVRMHSPTDT